MSEHKCLAPPLISYKLHSSGERCKCLQISFGALYNFKVGLLAAASSHCICQAFGNSAVSEHTARHWFKKFKLGDLSLCDELRSG